MFCPKCRAEYRSGFTRCSDCAVALVVDLPPHSPHDPDLRENERPDLARKSHFLAWFLPMMFLIALTMGVMLRPSLSQNPYVAGPLIACILVSNAGSYWMLYQAVRYERRVGKYAFLSFVPFLFVWYFLVRVPLRKEFHAKSDFIR